MPQLQHRLITICEPHIFQTAPMANAEFWPHFPPHFFNLILYVDDIALGKVSPLTYCQCIRDAAETGRKIRGLQVKAAQYCQMPDSCVRPGCDLIPNVCRVTRQFFLLLFCYYSSLLFTPFTGTIVVSAATHTPHMFIMGFSVRVLTFRKNGLVCSCLWSKALFITVLQQCTGTCSISQIICKPGRISLPSYQNSGLL